MARTKRIDIEDLADMAHDIVDAIDDLITRHANDWDVSDELKTLRRYAYIIEEKSPKIAKLRDFAGYKFAIIDPDTHELRQATQDEAMRLIMDYKQGTAIDILREWTVIDGKWVKRPEINPDGTPVKKPRF